MNSEENALKSGLSILLQRAWRLKWILIPLGMMMASGTWYLTRQQTKVYQASVQLIIDLEAPQYLPYRGTEVVSLGSGKSWNTREFFETQFRIIRSRQVSAEVVEKLNLTQDLDFLRIAHLPEEERLKKQKRIDPIALLQRQISLSPVAESHVVFVKVKDHNPERAARLADAVAHAYRRQNVGHKVSAAKEAVDWLNKKLTEIGTQRSLDEQALLAFKNHHQLLQSSLAERQNLLGLTIQSLEQQLIQATQTMEALRIDANQIKRASPQDAMLSSSRVLNSPLIQRLKEQALALENSQSSLSEKYLEDHPKLKIVNEQLERLRRVMKDEVKGIRKVVLHDLRIAETKVNRLRKELKKAKTEALTLQSEELKYRGLESAVESNRTLYQQMQVRLKEAELQAQTTANNVRVLDSALVPRSSIYPRLTLNLAAAGAAWLLLSLLLVIVIDLLDRSIKNQNQLSDWYQLTVLGSVPRIKEGRRPFKQDALVRNSELYVLENPTSTVAECVRTIRTNLLFMNPEKELKSLLVTSAAPREGKTMTCINLGMIMAMSGERILLIDSDLRRPRIHKVFGLINDRGFTNMLMNPDVEPDEVTRPTELDTLDILCSGPLPSNPAELLQTPAFKRTLSRLLEEYDRVIFDSPPVVPVTDAQIIGRQIHGTLLVARAQQTNRDVLRKAVELLRTVQVPLIGALLNGIDVSRDVYGHYYYQYKQSEEEETAEGIEARFDV